MNPKRAALALKWGLPIRQKPGGIGQTGSPVAGQPPDTPILFEKSPETPCDQPSSWRRFALSFSCRVLTRGRSMITGLLCKKCTEGTCKKSLQVAPAGRVSRSEDKTICLSRHVVHQA
jgi:hypothetical protein